CNDYTIFCKNTLHKSYNSTTYSNITIERTLHKIIITHITFYIYKKILFQAIKHMMHKIDTQLLCRHLGCHTSAVQNFEPTDLHTSLTKSGSDRRTVRSPGPDRPPFKK